MLSATLDDATNGPNWSEQSYTDQTIRQEIRVASAGSIVRIRLSSQYGTPMRVAGATIAVSQALHWLSPAVAVQGLSISSG